MGTSDLIIIILNIKHDKKTPTLAQSETHINETLKLLPLRIYSL